MSQHGCPERLSNRSKGFQEEGSQPTMELLVETLTGTAFEMTVSPSDTIFAIKSKICRVEGIPVSQQHLVYNLRELEDAMSLKALGICDGARLRLVLGMRGGPISSRRLPPPPEPWRDIERLLDSNRDDGDWGCGEGSGCRVTVVVFREGERVNMLRVRENADGSYSPADAPHSRHNCDCAYDSPPLPQLSYGGDCAEGAGGGAVGGAAAGEGASHQNAVTMSKMLELRKRMETLSMRRHPANGENVEIQKTRSEETLSVPSLLDDPESFTRTYTPYSEAEDTFIPLYDGQYTRYQYECSFNYGERYTILPPINTRANSDQSVDDVVGESDRLTLSDALANSLLATMSGGERGEDEPSIAPNIPAPEYGPLVGGPSGGGWWARGFGSSSQLAAPATHATHAAHATHATPAHARSASSLVAGAGAGAAAGATAAAGAGAGALAGAAPLSSSTPELQQLRRRPLPALARHPHTDRLHLAHDADTDNTAQVGSERRQRRIEKITELENSHLSRFGNSDETNSEESKKEGVGIGVEKVRKLRTRCGFCRKKLSIATVHTCRCGSKYCAAHRYAEVHGCAYDYKQPTNSTTPPREHKLPKI